MNFLMYIADSSTNGSVEAASSLCFKGSPDLNNKVFSLFSADGPPVVGHYDISDTDSNQESMCVETVRPTVIKHELKTHRSQDMAAHSGCIRALSSISGQLQTRYVQTDTFFSVKTGHLRALGVISQQRGETFINLSKAPLKYTSSRTYIAGLHLVLLKVLLPYVKTSELTSCK